MGKASIGELQARVVSDWLLDPESAGRAMTRCDADKARRVMDAISIELHERDRTSGAAAHRKTERPPIKVKRPKLPQPRAVDEEAADIEAGLRLFGSYRRLREPAPERGD
jgi:hypothetical protein